MLSCPVCCSAGAHTYLSTEKARQTAGLFLRRGDCRRPCGRHRATLCGLHREAPPRRRLHGRHREVPLRTPSRSVPADTAFSDAPSVPAHAASAEVSRSAPADATARHLRESFTSRSSSDREFPDCGRICKLRSIESRRAR